MTGTLCVAAFGLPRRLIISGKGISLPKSFAASSRVSGSALTPAFVRFSSAAVFRANFALSFTLLLITSNFTICRRAKADDAHPVFATNGKHNRVEAFFPGRDADPSLLAMVARFLLHHQHRVPIELASIIQRDAVLIAVRPVLLVVELAFHGNYCTYIKSRCPPRRRQQAPQERRQRRSSKCRLTSSAARAPLRSAPVTVAGSPVVSVASPAKKRVPPTGVANTWRAPLPPTAA